MNSEDSRRVRDLKNRVSIVRAIARHAPPMYTDTNRTGRK
ncbi:hypothetical protein CKA32_006297 [Geitlerinema sp. FC II]|nr:hypothetical protein CKA32_006297 [Geitlerinema sp. FC II]